MPKTPDTDSFIRDGLSRYEDARETVNAFQTSVFDLLSRVVNAKAEWRHFVPNRERGAMHVTKAQGAVFLHVFIAGQIPCREIRERVWLSLGMYWSPPLRRLPSPVASSTCWVDNLGSLVPFNEPDVNSVSLVPLFKKSELRLVADLSGECDVEQVLTMVFDAADAALGPLPREEAATGA